MRSKWAWAAGGLVALALLPAVRLAWLSRDGPHLGFYHDDGMYWVTAKSIAAGEGYRIPSLPGEPYQTKYPPVFPALLSVAWKLNPDFPGNLAAAAWLVWAPLPLLVALSGALLTRYGIGGRMRLLMCSTLALNPYLAYFGTIMMSELWATCFVLAALLLVAPETESRGRLALAGLCAAAAYLTKTVVAPLLIAVPAVLIWRRRRRPAALFVGGALPPVLAWHWWATAHRAPGTDLVWLYYTDYLGFFLRDVTVAVFPRMWYRNLGELFAGGGDLLLFALSSIPGGEYLSRLLLIAALAGVLRWARASRRWDYVLFAGGLFAVLLAWNFPPNERFLLPVLPLLILGVWTEALHLRRVAVAAWRRPKISNRVAAALAMAVLTVFTASLAARSLHAAWRVFPALAQGRRAAAEATQPLYAWIRDNTPPSAVFYAERDAALYLHTGRRATTIRGPLRYYYLEDRAAVLAGAERLGEFARARGLDYLLLTRTDFELDPLPVEQRRAAREALARDPGIRQVYESPAGTILEVNRRGP